MEVDAKSSEASSAVVEDWPSLIIMTDVLLRAKGGRITSTVDASSLSARISGDGEGTARGERNELFRADI